MKYVSQFGYVWKLRDSSHKELLEKIRDKEPYDLDKLGDLIGQITYPLDMSPEEAASELEHLRKKNVSR